MPRAGFYIGFPLYLRHFIFVYTKINTFGPSEIINYPDRAPSSAAQFDVFSFQLGMPNTKTRSLEEIGTANGLRSPEMDKNEPKVTKKGVRTTLLILL